VRASLPDDDAADAGATDGTGFPSSLVHPEVILEIASAVNPVEAGAVVAQTLAQSGANASPQTPGLLVAQSIAAS
jgi:hypothetical protein